jgi:hypothetical protein
LVDLGILLIGLILAGFIPSYAYNFREIKNLSVVCLFICLGYVPIMVVSTILVNGTMINGTAYYYDFPTVIGWGILDTTIFSALGGLIYVSVVD